MNMVYSAYQHVYTMYIMYIDMYIQCTALYENITHLNWPIWKATPAFASPPNKRLPASSRSISNLKFWLPLNTGSSMISRTTSSISRAHRWRSWSPSAALGKTLEQWMQPVETSFLLALQAVEKLVDGLLCIFSIWPGIKKISIFRTGAACIHIVPSSRGLRDVPLSCICVSLSTTKTCWDNCL